VLDAAFAATREMPGLPVMTATCETNGHIWGHDKCCVFCGLSLFAEPLVEVGDTIVSKFGNLWICEAWQALNDGTRVYVLRNRPQEAPDAVGTVRSGPLPDWANVVIRDSRRVWERPTPQCQCPSFAKAKGPYPSGFCPECKQWYPGVTREQAIARGDLTPCDRKGENWHCTRELGHVGRCVTANTENR
jgi:hypothetical protein